MRISDWSSDVCSSDLPVLWLIAVLPALPIVYFVWVLYRYLIEETDEYLKMRNVINALFGLGFLLIVATVWGFLASFTVVPHVESWMAWPALGNSLCLGQMWHRIRGAGRHA